MSVSGCAATAGSSADEIRMKAVNNKRTVVANPEMKDLSIDT